MKNNSTAVNNNIPKKSIHINNNSSLITAENSSTLVNNKSKRHSVYYANPITNKKFFNTTIFEKRHFQKEKLPKTHLKTDLYTTKNIFLTNTCTKKNIIESYTSRSPKKTKKKIINCFTNINHSCSTKRNESLPKLLSTKTNDENLNIFTCCDQELYPKYLQKLYLTQLRQDQKKSLSNSRINKKRKIQEVYGATYNYIQKTKSISRLYYYINLKSDRIQEFKTNIKTEIKSFDHTINKINTYKFELGSKIPVKLNDQIHDLYQRLFKERLEEFKQKQKLNDLQKDIESIKNLIQKKEIIKKTITKWIILLLTVKNGHRISKNDEAKNLEENKNKLIFENIEDMMFNFRQKENKTIRLMKKIDKINREKQEMMNELITYKKYGEATAKKNLENISEKEKDLFSLKTQFKELTKTLNNIEIQKRKPIFNKNDSLKKKTRVTIIASSNHENKFKKGNIYDLINNIYNNIINYVNFSKMKNLDFIINTENELKNMNIVTYKKALMQMKLIELIINYLRNYIKIKGEENINNMDIMKKTKQKIELEHKKTKAEKHKSYVQKKMIQLIKNLEKKNNKIYYLQGKKVNKYNMVVIDKIKKAERNKRKGKNNLLNIEDFLYDEADMKPSSMENIKCEFDLDCDEKEE